MKDMDLALTFDDVALVPQYNNLTTRSAPSLETQLSRHLYVDIPLIPSNMDTVISSQLARAMKKLGGGWIMHRFVKGSLVEELARYPKPYCVSIGVRYNSKDIKVLKEIEEDLAAICIDIAHGHSNLMLKTLEELRREFAHVDLIAGNVCHPVAYRDLVNSGADAVKVGIGSGAACTTRVVTGFGVPQFTAIKECGEVAKRLKVPIIADGGIRNTRDIILALAAGASTVMMGKVFAAMDESAAFKPNEKIAVYRGQASFSFQKEFFNEIKHVPEGEEIFIRRTGSIYALLPKILDAIKVGMTYGGARSIHELQYKAEFVRVTNSYKQESDVRP